MIGVARSTLVLGAATLALAAPAGARTIDSWEVTPDGKACKMVSTFSDDVTIGLLWSPKSGELGFITTVPHAYGVEGTAKPSLQLSFDGESPYTQWEDDRPTVITGAAADAVISTWGAAHSNELAKAMSTASHVKLRLDGKDIGTYDLSGSPAAYRALTHCGDQLASK